MVGSSNQAIPGSKGNELCSRLIRIIWRNRFWRRGLSEGPLGESNSWDKYLGFFVILEGTIRVLGIPGHLDLAMGRGWIVIFTTFPFWNPGSAVIPWLCHFKSIASEFQRLTVFCFSKLLLLLRPANLQLKLVISAAAAAQTLRWYPLASLKISSSSLWK